jgi:hypothetical protein
MLLVSSAQAGCGKWVVRYPETDFLDDPTFDAEIETSTGPTATAGEGVKTADADEDAGANPGNDVKAKDESGGSKAVKAQEQAEVPDASGNWLVHMDNMDNLAGSTLNLILIQSKDRLQGYGNLEEKSAEIPATTTGSISEDAISLDIKLVKDGTLNSDDRQYRLSLTLKKDAMKKGKLSGSYEYYLSDELASEGNATATRS